MAGSRIINGKAHKKDTQKMRKTILCFLVLFYSITAFCQHSYIQKLKNIAIITFPDTPKIEKSKSQSIYTVKINELYYSAAVSTVKKSLVDMLTTHLTDSLYAAIIKASLARPKARLLYKKNIIANGIKGIEFGYVSEVDSMSFYRYHQAFLLNNSLIMYGVNSFDSLKVDNSDIRHFFGTFKLTIRNADVQQENFVDEVFNWRTALIISLIIVFGTLIIYIIKRLIYR